MLVLYRGVIGIMDNAMVELELPKPTHSGGWKPYAHYNLNKVSTENMTQIDLFVV